VQHCLVGSEMCIRDRSYTAQFNLLAFINDNPDSTLRFSKRKGA
jgi:hypothetical protein